MVDRVSEFVDLPRAPDIPEPQLLAAFGRDQNRQLIDYLSTLARKVNLSDLTDGGTVAGNLDITGTLALGAIPDVEAAIDALEAFDATLGTAALEDYEEANWTPTIAFGGASVGQSYVHQIGRWTRIGRVVVAQFDAALSNKGSSTGAATIKTLPYTVQVVTGTAPISYFTGMSGLTGMLMGFGSTNVVNLVQSGATAVAAVNDTHFTNAGRVIGTIIYTI